LRLSTLADEAIIGQGQTVSDETEVSKFLSALDELLAANPGLLQSVDGTKTIMGSIIGKRMAEGIFLLPAETLNEMAKIRAFTQQPTIDSLTQALNEKGYLIPGDSRHLKYHCRLNGSYPRGWYLKDVACPQKNEVIPHSGTDKTNNSEPTGPTFPQCPPEKKENIFSTKNQENRDRLGEGKEKQENCGTSGTSGTIDSIDRLVDSDFDSKVSVPNSDPTVPSREALVRACFRTDYRTDYNNAMRDFQEGDEIEVARWRAEAWQKRGIVGIVEAGA
jgi:hypothetical protein